MHTQAQKGVDLFTQREFYESHEYFERAWRETKDESKEFYRVLIHLSGGFFRLTQGRVEAARKFFARAQHWLTFFLSSAFGIDTQRLREQVTHLLHQTSLNIKSSAILETEFPPIQHLLQERQR